MTTAGDLGSAPMVRYGDKKPLKRETPLKRQGKKKLKTFKEYITEASKLYQVRAFDDKTESEYSLIINSKSEKNAKLEAAVRFKLGKDVELSILPLSQKIDDLPKNHFNTVVITDPTGKETYK